MTQNNNHCPRCEHPMNVLYAVVMVEDCPNCHYYTQRRAHMPLMKGGLEMITNITTLAIERGTNLPRLRQVLVQQAARVKRRQAKRRNKGNGGSPRREEDWQ